jgi:hypothetical protein
VKNKLDFAAVHAYLCADGYVIRNPDTQKQKYYYIGLRNTNKTLLIDFQKKFEKVFGVKPYLNKDVDRCSVGSKSIYFNIVNNYGSFHSREWSVLKHMNKEQAALWLRAFFDCEGWVWVRKAKNRAIGTDSVNHRGLQQVAELLKEHFDINTSIRPRSNRDTTTLCIYGKDQLIKFEKEIGFLHSFKKKRLREAIETYVNYTWDFSNGVKAIIKEKSRTRKSHTVRIMSIVKENLEVVNDELNKLGIKSKIRKAKNGQGRKYYELSSFGQENFDKFLKYDLLSEEQIKRVKSQKEGE